MSRINQNINSMQSMRAMGRNQADLSTRLQRLSTGLRINTGKDAPAGLIASEILRSEIAGITQAVDNTQRATNVINVAEGALNEVSAQLLELQALTVEAANSGALSKQEIEANQLQMDSIISSINRIANTTQFGGRKLLDGSLGYSTSGALSTAIDVLRINAAKIPDNGNINVAVQVTGSAQLAGLNYTGGALTAPATIEVSGNDGVEQVSFASGATVAQMQTAINQLVDATGVSATLSGTALKFSSTRYGSEAFVAVRAVSGTFAPSASRDEGVDATVNINGQAAYVDGLKAKLQTEGLDVELTLDAALGAANGSTSFYITGGGAKFQIGSTVNRPSQISVGLDSIATSSLGNNVVGYLSSMASGGANTLVGGNTAQAQRILTQSIGQVATLRGRLGALQKNVLETNANSLGVALENVTASESAIRDADFAKETAALTRAQILVQANTSILAQANAQPQNVLSLLQG